MSRPELKWLPVSRLFVDPSYQRPIREEGGTNVRRIADKFDFRLAGALTVSPALPGQSDDGLGRGSFAILDGQHRWAAACRRKDVAELPCLVVKTETVAEQAALFLSLNRDRVAVQPIQQFWSAVVAGEASAVGVKKACDEAGVTIARVQSGLHPPRTTSSIATIKRAIADLGHAGTVQGLRCLAETHPDTASAFGGPIMAAVFALIGTGGAVATIKAGLRTLDFKEALVDARVARHATGGKGSIALSLAEIIRKRGASAPAAPAPQGANRGGDQSRLVPADPNASRPSAAAAAGDAAHGVKPPPAPARQRLAQAAGALIEAGHRPANGVRSAPAGGFHAVSTTTVVKFLTLHKRKVRPKSASKWTVEGVEVDRDQLLALANTMRRAMDLPQWRLER